MALLKLITRVSRRCISAIIEGARYILSHTFEPSQEVRVALARLQAVGNTPTKLKQTTRAHFSITFISSFLNQREKYEAIYIFLLEMGDSEKLIAK
jgi:hypothetical protein